MSLHRRGIGKDFLLSFLLSFQKIFILFVEDCYLVVARMNCEVGEAE